MLNTAEHNRVILPGSTIGILGGGQLGRMIALSGRQMGYRFVTLDPTEDAPCGQVADRQIVAAYDDAEAAMVLAGLSNVITYEFENVDVKVAQKLMESSYVPQGSKLLYTTQHRLREKRAIEAAGGVVAPYAKVDTEAQLRAAIELLGLPCVLKTAMGGYDGKGQRVIRTMEEAAAAFAALSGADPTGADAMEADRNGYNERTTKTELVLEKFVDFSREISIIAARNHCGEIKTFPVAENVHVDNILHLSIAPARISAEVAHKASQLAADIATSLEVVGLIAVEMFLTDNGRLYINELAPRPHNSGHYTMEACQTSQFEQHIRAICNLPLGPVEMLSPVVMINLLGEHVERLLQKISDGSVYNTAAVHGIVPKVHLYGKKVAKRQRKMGHINVLADNVQNALDWIEQIGIW